MDRKTILAVVISVVIIVGGMLLQSVLFPPKPPVPGTTQSSAPKPAGTESGQGAQVTQAPTPQPAEAQALQQAPATTTGAKTVAVPGKVVPLPESAPPVSQPATIMRDTDLYTLTFSSSGATLSSAKLKKYKNLDGSPVDMILSPKTETAGALPFAISFGDYKAEQLDVPFALTERSDGKQSTFDFSRTFLSPTGVPFTLHKTYLFDKDEYLFELRVTIENSVNDFPALDFGGFAYTLTMGPQIGPHYEKLDNTHDFRNYMFYADGKRQDMKVDIGQAKEGKKVTWASIVGKYFTVIAVLDATDYKLVYDSRKIADRFDHSAISFQRPALKSAKTTDTFRFYLGPKTKEFLLKYNDSAKNAFGIVGLHADEVVPTPFLIGPLAWLMQQILDFFYLIIPNYGIAIILLTILTKVVFLPLTFKSSESMAKMATLNPKMTEIRTRLKDKPDKMNQEIAELYRREKINPLSGCLPMLLQMPVFIALYNLLGNYFQLRGALFIPGWIPDLSVPEFVLTFPFAIPFLGTELRLLPLLMVASQLLSSKFTQPTGTTQQGGAQAKLFAYALPLVFLFMLYNMASGLVLYWTVQNILSTAQQVYINRLRKKREEESGQTPVMVKASVRTGDKSGVRTGK